MTTGARARHHLARGGALLAIVVGFFGGCSSSRMLELQGAERLASEVRSILAISRPSEEYQRERERLLRLGPVVDSILVEVAQDRREQIDVRGEALLLLAERQSPLALATLRSALQHENERVRSAAVLGLDRLAPISEPALELIRLAAEDRSRLVRLYALQSLDIGEVETIRRVLERETDPEVRQVAFQLVSLAEARGAPLVADPGGILRSASSETQPQIVFRPLRTELDGAVMYGDLRVEVPNGADVPLASMAAVVGNVVPAFFSPDRAVVVTETNGEIRIVHIDSHGARSLGPGIAPRLIPFSLQFVFLRERPDSHLPTADGMAVTYDVFRAAFNDQRVDHIGSLRAVTRTDEKGGESPVRWMVVAESGEGFVLQGENMETFPLPTPVWSPGGTHDP